MHRGVHVCYIASWFISVFLDRTKRLVHHCNSRMINVVRKKHFCRFLKQYLYPVTPNIVPDIVNFPVFTRLPVRESFKFEKSSSVIKI